MAKKKLSERERKGLEIARRMRIYYSRKRDLFLVPSQTNSKKKGYNVHIGEQQNTCTCEDYELRQQDCKHIYAVLEFIRMKRAGVKWPVDDQPVEPVKKPTYRQKWPAYRKAQKNEKRLFRVLLKDLCAGLEPLPGKATGRPRTPLCDMVFAAVAWAYTGCSMERFYGDLQEAHEKGLISHVPHPNSVFAYLGNPALTAVLQSLIRLSSLPLKEVETNFAVDSSGFSIRRYRRWFNKKARRNVSKRVWFLAHIMCGVKTNIVTAVEITPGNTKGDSPFLPELFHATRKNFSVQEVYADKAYSSQNNLQEIEMAEAVPYIPFKSNATGEAGRRWKRLLIEYLYNQEEFLKHYHQRSNVEATFAMIKAKFGSYVRSKKDVPIKNEILCKILAHNICCVIHSHYELGIELEF